MGFLVGSLLQGLGNAFGSLVTQGFQRLFMSKSERKNYDAQSYGTSLTDAQREQNAANEQMAVNAWERNEQSAENARQWQEHMQSTQYQRQVSDMQAAGLNPALMYGQTQSADSSGSGAAGSGPAASGASPVASGGALDSLANMLMATSQARLNEAQANLVDTQNEGEKIKVDYAVSWWDSLIRKNDSDVSVNIKSLDRIDQDIKTGKADELLKQMQWNKEQALAFLELQKGLQTEIDNKYRDEFNRLCLAEKDASIENLKQGTDESKARVEKIADERSVLQVERLLKIAETNETYQRALLESAQALYYNKSGEVLDYTKLKERISYDLQLATFGSSVTRAEGEAAEATSRAGIAANEENISKAKANLRYLSIGVDTIGSLCGAARDASVAYSNFAAPGSGSAIGRASSLPEFFSGRNFYGASSPFSFD